MKTLLIRALFVFLGSSVWGYDPGSYNFIMVRNESGTVLEIEKAWKLFSGSDWLGLSCDQGKCALTPTEILTIPTQYYQASSREPVFGARFIDTHKEKMLFQVRGAHGVKLGSVPSAVFGEAKLANQTLLTLGQNEYKLTYEISASGYDDKQEFVETVNVSMKVFLELGQTKQLLYSSANDTHYVNTASKEQIEPGLIKEQKALVVWAGDLDGDGKLDLVHNHSLRAKTDGSIAAVLYLSSEAKNGGLVVPFGNYYYSDPSIPGC